MAEKNNIQEIRNLEDLFKTIGTAIQLFGIDYILNKLTLLSIKRTEKDKIIESVIVKCICEQFNIKESELFSNKRGDMFIARIIYISLMPMFTDVKPAYYTYRFNVTRQVLYQWAKKGDSFNRNDKQDVSVFFKHYDDIYNNVQKEIKKLTINGNE